MQRGPLSSLVLMDYIVKCKFYSLCSLYLFYADCTPLVSKLYRDLNGSCFNISHQTCFIGSLEKFEVKRWYRNITSCPLTTIPPTTTHATSKSSWYLLHKSCIFHCWSLCHSIGPFVLWGIWQLQTWWANIKGRGSGRKAMLGVFLPIESMESSKI